MNQPPLRVMVVDDTVHYRSLLSEIVASLGDVKVVATASRGSHALNKLQSTQTDLVLLDLEMPEMNGIATLQEIRRLHQIVSVVVVAGRTPSTERDKAEVLRMGAIAFIEKPEACDRDHSMQQLREKLSATLQLARIRQNYNSVSKEKAVPPPSLIQTAATVPTLERHPVKALPSSAPVSSIPHPASEHKRIDIVVIGVSTGGPAALMQMIPSLPADLGVPVLIVQHMPAQFTASLAQDIAKKSKIIVREATEGELITPNVALVAPGGRHMVVRPTHNATSGGVEHVIGLHDGPAENSCRPAVDVLFRSVAAHFKGNALAVIMTGMGADGCEGVRAMRQAGSYCVTQSASTCVVYGMPMAVDEAGLSHESVPLRLLASRISSLVKG